MHQLGKYPKSNLLELSVPVMLEFGAELAESLDFGAKMTLLDQSFFDRASTSTCNEETFYFRKEAKTSITMGSPACKFGRWISGISSYGMTRPGLPEGGILEA